MNPYAPRILPAADRIAAPWKNGNGEAVVVDTFPEAATADDFDWRVSIATIDADADFSRYPGIQRWIMPLAPAGLTLEVDGETSELPGLEHFEFRGESAVRAVDVSQKSLDINLMVRRRVGVGRITTHVVDGSAMVYTATNEYAVIILLEPQFGLEYLDAIELKPGSELNIEGSGPIAVARVFLDETSDRKAL